MRKNFTPEQMLHIGWQAESGTPLAEVCRKMGITEQPSTRWKRQIGGIVELTTEANSNMRQGEQRDSA
jgi:Transposase